MLSPHFFAQKNKDFLKFMVKPGKRVEPMRTFCGLGEGSIFGAFMDGP